MACWLDLTRVVTVMVKIFVGWLVMFLTTVTVFLVGTFTVKTLTDSGAPMPYGDAGPDFLLFMIFASSFTGYWASVRFVIQPRTAAPFP